MGNGEARLSKENKGYYDNNYPVEAYKKFEYIPPEILKSICSRINKLIGKKFKRNKNVSILFGGAGYGRIEVPFSKFLEDHFPHINLRLHFIDLSKAMIDELKKNLSSHQLRSQIQIDCQDINDLLHLGKYDLTFALFSFHLFGAKQKTLEYLKSLTKRNGLIILSEETGDFNYLENNFQPESQKTKRGNTEYGQFWKFFHEQKSNKTIADYTCDLQFLTGINEIQIFDIFEEKWTIENLTYNDIRSFITGENKIFNFFNYHSNNETVLKKWLSINSNTLEQYVRREEGHRFYVILNSG